MAERLVAYIAALQKKHKFPEWVAFHLIHQVSRICCFWGTSLFFYIIYKNGWFKKYKLQGDRMPNPELVKKTLKHNIEVDLLTYWIASFAFYHLLTLPKKTEVKEVETEKENQIKKGWANLRLQGDAPSYRTHFWQVGLAYLLYDAMFYWSHRLLHRKEFYLPIHKIHHQYHTPIGISSSFEHIVESIAQLFNWYVPLGVVGYLNGDLHASTVFLYHCFRWVETVDAHSGYALPFSPFYFIPIFGGALAHDDHHRYFYGNYGATVFWDWLCGTTLKN